jgi:hypothetical protein
MMLKLAFALGLAIGTAIYQAIRYGVGDIDWTKVAFTFVFGLVVALLIPRRFLGRTQSAHR